MTTPDPSTSDGPRTREIVPLTVAAVRETVPMDQLRDFYDRAYRRVAEALGRQGLAPAGPALGIYFGRSDEAVDVAAGFPTAAPFVPDGEVREVTLPGGRIAEVVHHGAYDELGRTYRALEEWMHEEGLVPGGLVWEAYLTMPTPGADPAGMMTKLSWMLAEPG